MTSDDGHHLYERRRLRRRVGFWRLVALLVLLVAVGGYLWQSVPRGSYIARHTVTGTIFDNPDRDALLRRVAEDRRAEALILRIDSPGGTIAGSEALFEAVRAVAEQKPVVAVMGEVAASGGYIAALAADRIIARGNTITGSIGVIAEFPNFEGLLETVGVDFSRVASAPLKAEPSPLRAPSEAALAAQADLVADSYDWFIGLVRARRDLDEDAASTVGDGRIFTGRQAREAGLIDDIGSEAEALDWLREAHGLSARLPVRDVRVRSMPSGVVDLLLGDGTRARLDRWLHGPRLMAIIP